MSKWSFSNKACEKPQVVHSNIFLADNQNISINK